MSEYIVLGGTGHVGGAVVNVLLEQGLSVTVITSNSDNVAGIEASGAEAAVINIHDTQKLKTVFKTGRRLFLLNPPALPSVDTVLEEQKNLKAILDALLGSGLEWIVAESTYGAQPGNQIGDLGVLYEMEQALKEQSIPFAIVRGAYYYNNWDALLDAAKQGQLPGVYPIDFKLPMVAPVDIGRYAAQLLAGKLDSGQSIHFVEGPERYSLQNVAAAFTKALGKPVTAVSIPKDEWLAFYKKAGFSAVSAQYMVNMAAIVTAGQYEIPAIPEKGTTTIEAYIRQLVEEKAG